MDTGLHVKHPLFLSDFNKTWIFLTDLRKVLISNFVTIRSVGDALFFAGRWTDRRDEANSLASQFFERAKNEHRDTIGVKGWETAKISMKLATLRRYRPRLLTKRTKLDLTLNSCNQLYSTLWHFAWKYHSMNFLDNRPWYNRDKAICMQLMMKQTW
jgi:hypothetical protein